MPTTPRMSRGVPDPIDHGIARVDWAELGPAVISHWGRKPNGRFMPEHLTVYGKSGNGKSYFVGYMLRMRAVVRRSHVVIVATKKADDTLTDLGWPIIDTWPPGYGEDQVIFWAKAKGISEEHLAPQRAKIKRLMDKLWVPRANTVVYWDELTYLEQDLRLKRELATFYREGRTNGITNVASMQRPAGVSRLAHSEAGWTVSFKPKDMDDRKRIAEVFGDRQRFMAVLGDLDAQRYEFLIRHDRTGESYISSLPNPSGPDKRSRASMSTVRSMPAGVRSAHQ